MLTKNEKCIIEILRNFAFISRNCCLKFRGNLFFLHIRVIAPDFIGFGKSDKYSSPVNYTHEMHTLTLRGVVKKCVDRYQSVVVCPNFVFYKCKFLQVKISFATVMNELSVLKLFELSNGDLRFRSIPTGSRKCLNLE